MKSLLLIIITSLALSPMSFAKNHKKGEKHKEIFKQLDLNETQRSQLKKLRENNKGSMKALRDAKHSAKEALMQGMKTNAAKSQLDALNNKLIAAQSKIMTNKYEKMLSIRSILKEKSVKFFELKEKMHKERKGKKRK